MTASTFVTHLSHYRTKLQGERKRTKKPVLTMKPTKENKCLKNNPCITLDSFWWLNLFKNVI